MGYLGNKPTAVPIESSDLADNLITSAKIANGAITGDDINSTFNIGSKTVTLPAASVTAHASVYIDWQSVVTASTLTAVAGRGYPINTTSNACTVTLPASASAGDTIKFIDYFRNFGTNALTLNPNSLKFQGNTSPNPVYDTNGQAITITYVDATQGWLPTTDDDVTLETPQTVSVTYLVVAGGGGGGKHKSGGAGAGGLLTSTAALSPSTVYTVTVGSGGAGSSSSSSDGSQGQNSVLSGTGISTVTAIGGGGGGSDGVNGSSLDGGSGGGAGGGGNLTSVGDGTSGQGNDGGQGVGGSDAGGGGGGGAGAVGVNAAGTTAGNGGAGTASSITGASVTYAGGGGGAHETNGGTNGSGGSGGGGAGDRSGNGTNGTANTGGGGGASHSSTGGTGGTGVVILRIPTADYSGTTSGSPTVTTDGSFKVVKFTASGSYTA